MATNTTKVAAGALLLIASTAVIMATGATTPKLPAALGALAALGMAAGALLLGMSEESTAV